MSTPIEDRLRAHFADRAERERLAPPTRLSGDLPASRPRDHRRWPLLAAAALVLVAGTVAGIVVAVRDDDPHHIDTITPDVEQTTTLAPTTSAVTTTTSGLAPTTTTTEPRPDASRIRSVVVSSLGVMGWWDGTRWVAPSEGAVPARAGDPYLVTRLEQPTTEAVGSAPGVTCDYDPGSAIQDIALEPSIAAEGIRTHVAVSGVDEIVPRTPLRVPSTTPEYVDAARQVLADLGLDTPEPQLTDVLQVDLDGDGVNEVLVAAEQDTLTDSGYGSLGDYEVVFVRWVSDGAVRTTVLEHDIVTAADEMFESSGDYYTTTTDIAAIADLNGDDRMEVVVSTSGWEYWFTKAFEFNRAEPVLSIGCGL